MLGDRGRWGISGFKSGCNGRHQRTCRSCFWEEEGLEFVLCGEYCREVNGRADLVDTIVGGRDASRVGWWSRWSSWHRIFGTMSSKRLSPRHC